MIIIEGPDGVGKSTAAEKIAGLLEEHGVVTRHMTKPGKDWDYHHDFLKLVNHGVVQDRFHLGGLVYGFLCGLHPTKIKKWRFRKLLQELRKRSCFTVVMYDGSDTHYAGRIRTLTAERQEMFRSDQSIAVNATYRALVRCGRWIDASICDMSWDVNDRGFPMEADLRTWIEAHDAEWVRRHR